MLRRLISKGIYLLAACALFGGVVACEKPESERYPEQLQIFVATTTPDAFKTKVLVSVKCDFHWTAELEDPSWGSIKVISTEEGVGGSFYILMSENTSMEDRENTLVVKAGKGEISEKIVQGGLGSFFKPRTLELSGTKPGSVTFDAPGSWVAEVVDGSEWLTITSASGESGSSVLECKAKDANENLGSREGRVRVTIGMHLLELPVVQCQKDIILSSDATVSLAFAAQEFSVYTQYNVDYSVEISVPWIHHISTKAPLNEGVERFSVEENNGDQPRTGVIKFLGGDALPLSLTVTQDAVDPILLENKPGFYSVDGQDYIWGEDGWNQSSLLEYPDGSYQVRVASTGVISAVELSGIRFDVPYMQANKMQLRLRSGAYVPFFKQCTVCLVYKDGDRYWFKESSGSYFIIEKED